MTLIILLIILLNYYVSFRFFFWLLSIEMLMIILIFFSFATCLYAKIMFSCCLLILGACEVGLALTLLVSISRFKGIEKKLNLKCEGY